MPRRLKVSGPYCPLCQNARHEASINPNFDIADHVERCKAGGCFIPATVCAEFRVWMRELGQRCGKTEEQIYKLWHNYTATCSNYDQSPVKSEFEQWYALELMPVVGVSHAA